MLKIPEGTLSSRLATGRQHLARKLTRHGLAMSAGTLAMALTQQAASAALRTGLVSVSTKAAILTAAGQSVAGLLSAQALALSQGALKTMLLNKLKVISLVCLGIVVGGLGAGLGVPKLMAEPAALPAQAEQPDKPSETRRPPADNLEPIDGSLLLNEQIQKHLQLTRNQINRLQAVSREVDGKSEAKRKEIERIQKQIEDLQQQIARLQQNISDGNADIGKVRDSIEGERKQSLGKAAPDILSARALQRLREIQRQRRGLRALLQDPKVQQMLKVDDEQVRKIEGILKKEAEQPHVLWQLDRRHLRPLQSGVAIFDYDNDGWPDLLVTGQDHWFAPRAYERVYAGRPDLYRGHALWQNQVYLAVGDGRYEHIQIANNRALIDVLTDAQKKMLLDWVGKPYNSPSWQELWDHYAKDRPDRPK
jgi:hypothetical protein